MTHKSNRGALLGFHCIDRENILPCSPVSDDEEVPGVTVRWSRLGGCCGLLIGVNSGECEMRRRETEIGLPVVWLCAAVRVPVGGAFIGMGGCDAGLDEVFTYSAEVVPCNVWCLKIRLDGISSSSSFFFFVWICFILSL